MKYLIPEVEANARTFASEFLRDISSTHRDRAAFERKFVPGYSQVTSLQAWRTLYFQKRQPIHAHGFFLECQNDALQSVALSLLGMWRPALQSLRSALEGGFNAIYYADHRIEEILWEQGRHRLTFAELINYFESHPAALRTHQTLNPLPLLQHEFAELSRAVHGSSLSFRMTSGHHVVLTRNEDSLHSMWLTRHSAVMQGLNLLLCGIYRDDVSTGVQY